MNGSFLVNKMSEYLHVSLPPGATRCECVLVAVTSLTLPGAAPATAHHLKRILTLLIQQNCKENTIYPWIICAL